MKKKFSNRDITLIEGLYFDVPFPENCYDAAVSVEFLHHLRKGRKRRCTALQAMSPKELQALWKCSEAIARLNVERLRDMDLRRRLAPAF